MSVNPACGKTPALLTQRSRRPNSRRAVSTSSSLAAGSVTSAPTPTTRPAPLVPARRALIFSATEDISSWSRSPPTPLMPRRASSSRKSAPMPRPAPVTTTVRPTSSGLFAGRTSWLTRPGLLSGALVVVMGGPSGGVRWGGSGLFGQSREDAVVEPSGGQSAVDDDFLARDVGGVVGQQEGDDARDFLGSGESACRDRPHALLHEGGVGGLVEQ